MKKICYIVAMRAEAQPLIEYYGLREVVGALDPLPCMLYEASSQHSSKGEKDLGGASLYVVVNGTQGDGAETRDLIGCEAACVATMAAIERLGISGFRNLGNTGVGQSQDEWIVISSGTCGGWKRYGMEVGKVYVADGVMFHDRRVPGDNCWDTQGLGNYPVWAGSWRMAEALGLSMGKVTTGSSFDMTEEEDRWIDQNGGRLKEMEGAAVAFVCSLYKIPVVLVKAVTNLRDAADDDIDAFQNNLKKASNALLEANIKIIEYLTTDHNP